MERKEAEFQELLSLQITAVVLHHSGDTGIQLLPVHSTVTLHRGIDTFFLRIHLLWIDHRLVRPQGTLGGVPAGIVTGSGGMAMTSFPI